jgi:hypothetical protein
MLSLGFLTAWWQGPKGTSVPKKENQEKATIFSNLALQVKQGYFCHILLLSTKICTTANLREE